MIEHLTDRAKLIEARRRARTALEHSTGDLNYAERVHRLAETGIGGAIAHESRPNIERARAKRDEVAAHVADLDAAIAELDAADAAEAERVEREQAATRARAIEQADVALLDARIAHDRAVGTRIGIALAEPFDRAAYLAAVAESDAAQISLTVARTARAALEH